MAGKGYVKVSRDGLRVSAAERQLFVELCVRASVKSREVMGVKLLRGQLLASTRELGDAIGKNPMFVLRHLRRLQAAGVAEVKQVTLPSPVNRSKIRLLLTIPSLLAASVTSGAESVTSHVTSHGPSDVTSRTTTNMQTFNNIERANSGEKIALKTDSVTSRVTSGAKSVTSGRFIPIIYSRKNGLERMITTSSVVPPSAVPASEAEAATGGGASRARVGGPRRASRGRLLRHDAEKSSGEGEKQAVDAKTVPMIGRKEKSPENAPQKTIPRARAVEAEIRELMANDMVRFQLHAKSGGMDEATAASLIPEFAGQVELEGKEEEHGTRLILHFAYWLGKKKSILEKQQKYADERQRSAEADRRDMAFLYEYMHS